VRAEVAKGKKVYAGEQIGVTKVPRACGEQNSFHVSIKEKPPIKKKKAPTKKASTSSKGYKICCQASGQPYKLQARCLSSQERVPMSKCGKVCCSQTGFKPILLNSCRSPRKLAAISECGGPTTPEEDQRIAAAFMDPTQHLVFYKPPATPTWVQECDEYSFTFLEVTRLQRDGG